jgi:iron complex transport system ATP-binding protein
MDYSLQPEVILVNIHLNMLTCKYGEHEVLRSISGTIPSGITALIGPNGSGKTTLLKCIAGILPFGGDITFDQKTSHEIPHHERESMLSFLPQYLNPNIALSVFEVILLGRMSSLKWRVGKADCYLVDTMLHEMGLSAIRDRCISELSGGQRQMVFFAQAMIKSPKILLLDEPTNNLDLQYQLELFNRINTYVKNQGVTTIISLHDINMACRYATSIIVLKDGTVVTSGKPEETITCNLLLDVYHIKADIYLDSRNNHQIVPIDVVRT